MMKKLLSLALVLLLLVPSVSARRASESGNIVYANGDPLWDTATFSVSGADHLVDGEGLKAEFFVTYPPLGRIVFGAVTPSRFTYECKIIFDGIASERSFLSLALAEDADGGAYLFSVYPDGKVYFEKYDGGTNFKPLASSAMDISLEEGKEYAFKLVSNEGTLHFFINGRCVIECAYPEYGSEKNVGIFAKGVSLHVKSVGLYDRAEDLVSINDTFNTDIRVPDISCTAMPVLIANDADGIMEDPEIRPAVIHFNVKTENGTLVSERGDGDVLPLAERVNAVKDRAVMMFSVSDVESAEALSRAIRKERWNGCTVISRSPQLVRLVAENNQYAISGIDLSREDGITGADDVLPLLLQSDSNIVVLSESQATMELVAELSRRLITVYVKCGNTVSNALNAAYKGADGIIISDTHGMDSAFSSLGSGAVLRAPELVIRTEGTKQELDGELASHADAIYTEADGDLERLISVLCVREEPRMLYARITDGLEVSKAAALVDAYGMSDRVVFFSDDADTVKALASEGYLTAFVMNGEELFEVTGIAASSGCAIACDSGSDKDAMRARGISVFDMSSVRTEEEGAEFSARRLEASLDDANRIIASLISYSGEEISVTADIGFVRIYGDVTVSGDYLEGEGSAVLTYTYMGKKYCTAPVNVGQVEEESEGGGGPAVRNDPTKLIITASVLAAAIGIAIFFFSIKKRGRKADA